MQCTATNRNGTACASHAVRGARVCRMHGGAAPQVKRAAEIRSARLAAHAQAERMTARAGVDADPIEHLLDSLYIAAALVAIYGEMVNGLDARAADETCDRDGIRGELGYLRDPEAPDALTVVSKDRLLALSGRGMAAPHPYLVLYEQAVERRGRLAKLCIDAGVAERQARLAEQEGALVVQLIRGVLTDLGVVDRPEVPSVVRRHLALVSDRRNAA